MPNINQSSLITQLQTVINGLTVATETKERLITLARSAQAIGANNSAIITQLETLISTLPPSEALKEVALLIVSLALITENRVLTVATIGDLPTTASAGSVYFVNSEGYPYIRRLNGTWVLMDPTLQGAPATSNAYAWGSPGFGQLGDDTTTGKSSPVSVVGGFADWVQVAAGGSHRVGVRANGTAWAWGNNTYGRLGDNTQTNRSSPVSVVGGFTDWVQVSAGGSYHTVGLRANGTAWAWGGNYQGQLGDGTTTGKSSPVSVVGGFTDWVQVSAQGSHTVALRSNGTAWAWGRGANGRLGDNDENNKSSPVSVVGGFTDWVQVSAGGFHSAGVRANGTAWSWGRNSFGELGNNDPIDSNTSSPVSVVGGFTNWVQVSAGNNFSVGVRANGTAWAWGYGTGGRLGDGTTTLRKSPVLVVGGFTDWVQVDAGNYNSVGVRANGTAWAWGSNFNGQLGNATGPMTSTSSPVSVIGGFTNWVQVSISFDGAVALRS